LPGGRIAWSLTPCIRPPRQAHFRHPSDRHDSEHEPTRNRRECWRICPVAVGQRPVPLCTYREPIKSLSFIYLLHECAAYHAPESQSFLHQCRTSRCTRIAAPAHAARAPTTHQNCSPGRYVRGAHASSQALVGAPHHTGRTRPPKADAHQANREYRVITG
jgi:hypothetical protein